MGTQIITDGVSPFDAATLNQFVSAGGASKLRVQLWYGRVRYDGAGWIVESAADSAGLTTASLVWDAGSGELQMQLVAFEQPPVVLAAPVALNTAVWPRAHASSNTLALVRFYDGAGVHLTSPTAAMDVNVMVIGV